MDARMYSEFSSDDLPYSKVNKKVEKLIRKHGGYTVIPKEVKKLSRPYWEVKVVKVKKEEQKGECVGSALIDGKSYVMYRKEKSRLYYKKLKLL